MVIETIREHWYEGFDWQLLMIFGFVTIAYSIHQNKNDYTGPLCSKHSNNKYFVIRKYKLLFWCASIALTACKINLNKQSCQRAFLNVMELRSYDSFRVQKFSCVIWQDIVLNLIRNDTTNCLKSRIGEIRRQ